MSASPTSRAVRALVLSVATCLLLAGCGAASPGGVTAGASVDRTTPAPIPTPARDPEAERAAAVQRQVDAALADLDRRGQVAQLLVVGVGLDELDAGEALIRDVGVGGVFLRGRSTVTADELGAVTRQWAALRPQLRTWVAADQEGGAVQTLSGPGFADLPGAVEQGALRADQLAALADGLGASLAAAGVTLNLAPVADVVPAGTGADNAPIGAYGREYGSTGPAVVTAAGAVVDGVAAHGVTATLKHFPGLGRVRENTDHAAGVTDTVTTAGDEQVAAFGTLAGSPARPFVMMSSATYTQIDPGARAVFSAVVIGDLLRGRLGFDGVVISDDLGAARAVRDVPVGERAVSFLAAGGTLVLTVDRSTAGPMIDAVLARDAADPAFAARVDAAVRTALTAKAEAGLLG